MSDVGLAPAAGADESHADPLVGALGALGGDGELGLEHAQPQPPRPPQCGENRGELARSIATVGSESWLHSLSVHGTVTSLCSIDRHCNQRW